eukprot:jgi/Chlat1/5464/Chrsp36S05424
MDNERQESLRSLPQVYHEDMVRSKRDPALLGLVTKVAGLSDSEDDDDDLDDEHEHDHEQWSDSEGAESSGVDDEAAGEEDANDDDGNQEDGVFVDDMQALQQGHAIVYWLKLGEREERLDQLEVLDRAFLHGDVVAKASEPLGQTGTVTGVQLLLDLELGTDCRLQMVPAQQLQHVRPFRVGNYVLYGLWLGRVEEVVDNVTIRFEDGCVCKVLRATPERLIPKDENDPSWDEGECPYYPGLVVRATSNHVFRSAKWLRGSFRNQRDGVVTAVEPGDVSVNWMAACKDAMWTNNTPPATLDGSKLVPMNYFSYTCWQLGDRALVPDGVCQRFSASQDKASDASDVDASQDEPAAAGTTEASNSTAAPAEAPTAAPGSSEACGTGSNARRTKRADQPRRRRQNKKRKDRKEPAACSAALVVGTHTTVDVLWQDRTVGTAVPAHTLVPVTHLGDHDFWPDEYVLEASAQNNDGRVSSARKTGIVHSVNAKERTAVVKWLKRGPGNQLLGMEEPEVVSVYELSEHTDFSYRLGDVVLRLPTNTDDAGAGEEAGHPAGDEYNKHDEAGTAEAAAHTDATAAQQAAEEDQTLASTEALSDVGEIVGHSNGQVKVAWADGSCTLVGPEEIYVVSHEEDEHPEGSVLDEGEEHLDDDGHSSGWETVDEGAWDEGDQREQASARWEMEEAATQAERSWMAWRAAAAGMHNDDITQPSAPSPSQSPATHPPEAQRQSAAPADRVAEGHVVSRLARSLLSRLPTQWLGYRAEAARTHTDNHNAGTSPGLRDIVAEEADPHAADDHLIQRTRRYSASSVVLSSMFGPSLSACGGSSRARSGVDPDAASSAAYETVSSVGYEDAQDHMPTTASPPALEAADAASSPHRDSLPAPADDTPEAHAVDAAESPAFARFDTADDISDHYFKDRPQQISNRRFAARMQHEWSLLQTNLPDTIYVRCYEERIELLRAVIVGAAGTPYHDGLYFFDFYFPPEYPQSHFRLALPKLLRCSEAYLAGARVGGLDEKGMPAKPRSQAVEDGSNTNGQQEAAPAGTTAGADDGPSEGFKIMLAKMKPQLEAAIARSADEGGEAVHAL